MGNKSLRILVYLYIVLLPLFPSKLRVASIPVNADIILGGIILLYALLVILYKNNRNNFIYGIKDFFSNYFSIFATLLLVMMLVSSVYAKYKLPAVSESFRFSGYIILYFIIKYEVNDKNTIDNIIKCFIATTSFLCIIGLIQIFTRIGVSEFIYHGSFGTRVRVPSTLGNPNSFGGLLLLSIFPVIMLCINERKKKTKLLYLICSLLMFSNIILTESRNAWLGLAIGSVILAIIYNIKLIFAFLGIGTVTLLFPQVSTRLKELTDMSQNIGRIRLWEIALIIIKEHPIRGIGNGNYQKLYSYYITKYPQLRYNDHKEFSVHNNYLKIQSELGIIGTIGFLGMIFSAMIRIKKLISMNIDDKYVAFFKGALASLAAFAFINMSDDFFMVPKIASYFWIIIAIGEALHYKVNNSVTIQEGL
ncbi:O-antigen ligase family protein [Clostridium sp. YIM B02515]|uniref:O-antigen ligase family protein n=1 Tax=Clostridium rhizosphaerae TaxID=2803861 RepID=A0ABS1TFK9_9CLOT|nr:O-antigen ligase family protein [Clostridium rhizosphaerae]MBL4938120.1 O-antigen ligase family protein [Clostridium rhizosphaerae]